MKNIFEFIDNNERKFLSFWEDICNLEGVAEDKESLDVVADKIQEFARVKRKNHTRGCVPIRQYNRVKQPGHIGVRAISRKAHNTG